MSYNSECLVELFLNFAVLRKYGGGPVLRNAQDFLTQNAKQTILDKNAIAVYSAQVKADIITCLLGKGYSDADAVYAKEMAFYREKWKGDENSLLRIVSAKDYLLPLKYSRFTGQRTDEIKFNYDAFALVSKNRSSGI